MCNLTDSLNTSAYGQTHFEGFAANTGSECTLRSNLDPEMPDCVVSADFVLLTPFPYTSSLNAFHNG